MIMVHAYALLGGVEIHVPFVLQTTMAPLVRVCFCSLSPLLPKLIIETDCLASTNCNGNGECDSLGSCVCSTGWDGSSCNTCAANWYGDSCQTSMF